MTLLTCVFIHTVAKAVRVVVAKYGPEAFSTIILPLRARADDEEYERAAPSTDSCDWALANIGDILN